MTANDEARERGRAPLPDGGSIAYEVHGAERARPPLLLIRPLGGSMSLWGPFRAKLAETLRVVSFDLRGSGLSSHDPAWVTTWGLAKDSLRVLDHLEVQRAHVFGISLGGMTATWIAARAPERVAKLCIASAPAAGVALSRAGLRRGLAMAACFAQPGKDVEASLVDRVLSRRFRLEHPDRVRNIEASVRAEPATRHALVQHGLAGAMHDARSVLRDIRAPTLVLAGDHDGLLGSEAPRALAAGIAGSTFEIVSEAGHDLTLERPLVVAERLLRFLAD